MRQRAWRGPRSAPRSCADADRARACAWGAPLPAAAPARRLPCAPADRRWLTLSVGASHGGVRAGDAAHAAHHGETVGVPRAGAAARTKGADAGDARVAAGGELAAQKAVAMRAGSVGRTERATGPRDLVDAFLAPACARHAALGTDCVDALGVPSAGAAHAALGLEQVDAGVGPLGLALRRGDPRLGQVAVETGLHAGVVARAPGGRAAPALCGRKCVAASCTPPARIRFEGSAAIEARLLAVHLIAGLAGATDAGSAGTSRRSVVGVPVRRAAVRRSVGVVPRISGGDPRVGRAARSRPLR